MRVLYTVVKWPFEHHAALDRVFQELARMQNPNENQEETKSNAIRPGRSFAHLAVYQSLPSSHKNEVIDLWRETGTCTEIEPLHKNMINAEGNNAYNTTIHLPNPLHAIQHLTHSLHPLLCKNNTATQQCDTRRCRTRLFSTETS
jgi:hypothetical protein